MLKRKDVNMLEGSIVKGLLAMALPICTLLCIFFPTVKKLGKKVAEQGTAI